MLSGLVAAGKGRLWHGSIGRKLNMIELGGAVVGGRARMVRRR